MENLRPQMEVRARRIGGAAYQVPSPVRGPRKDSLAIRWLIAAARERSNSQYHTFAAKLAAEITDVLTGTGAAYKKKVRYAQNGRGQQSLRPFPMVGSSTMNYQLLTINQYG